MRPEQWKTQLAFQRPLHRLSRLSGFSGASLFASATYAHENGGARVLDINNPNPMDTAQRLNTRLGLRTDRWSLILNARNLTDESYRIWENLDNDLYRRVDPRYVFAEFSFNLR
jgi:outer membrane receptor protein involved in Fe transport